MTTYLSDYSRFKTVEEMDKASNEHISANYNQLSKTDRAVLNMIRRYSVKYGAAHLKHLTIEKALKKSNSTIRRSLVKLEKLNIIKRIKFLRKVLSGLGANIYAILPFKAKNEQSEMNSRKLNEKADGSKPESIKSENEPFFNKSLNNLRSNTYQQATFEAPTSFYSHFKAVIISMLGNDSQKLISRFYGIYKAQSLQLLKFSIYADRSEQFEALAMQSISITLQASKRKPIANLAGFFNGVYSNLINKHVIGLDGLGKQSGENIEWKLAIEKGGVSNDDH